MTHPDEQMSTVDRLIQDLRQEARRRRLTKKSLAEVAGLHPNTLAGFNKDGWAPSIYTLRNLERVLLPIPTGMPGDQPTISRAA
jgi:transcriptional regulator with XRE-family HTH domain